MSTTGMSDWAVDLKDVGAIYPFQGSEFILVIIAVVAWIGWTLWQLKSEQNTLKQEAQKHGNADVIRKALDSD